MTPRSTTLFAVLLTSGLTACTTTELATDDGSLEEGPGPATTVTEDAGSETDIGENESETGSQLECLVATNDEMDDASSITLRLVNERNDTIVIPTSDNCGDQPFALEFGEVPLVWQPGPPAGHDCDSCNVDGCIGGEPSGGIVLEPGETWEQVWTGYYWENIAFPADCPENPCENAVNSCYAGRQLINAELTARIQYYVCPVADCSCFEGDDPNSCEFSGTPADQEIELQFSYPSGLATLEII